MTIRNAASMGTYGSAWQAHGYSGHAPTADQVDRHKGRAAIVAGSGIGVFGEMKRAVETLVHVDEQPIIFAVNDVGMFLPRVDHWCSLHGHNLANWKAVRWQQSRPHETTEYHAPDQLAHIHHVWEGLTPMFPLSGYFAMQLAWIMGCTTIVLCGCPGDGTPRFFDYVARTDFSYGGDIDPSGIREMIENEMNRLPDFKRAVRSMSGWTRDYFGGL